ncbi:8-oxoguanine deaminase [Parahaliea maris]|uniref:8-oxoguanine deaminase n=1 Tax=Parahaliea maris TaxID=2716870 RepID=A0A5C9A375_9GAMM|nr:8-oxoguanine deaminase [Parahaliea maris]TXS95323.1 8-oxoguanine deaminase [Parahaliea maris]
MNATRRTWIRNPQACFTATPDAAAGGVVICGDRIEALLAAGETPSVPVDHSFDARDHVLLPGLVNTHHHFYQTLTRAVPEALNKELFDWLQSLYPVWACLTPEMLYTATQVALAELLLSGCTTAADHHYLFPEGMEDAIDIQVEASAAIGNRVTLTRGSMSLGVDDGGLPPQSTVQSEERILADCERVIQRYHQSGEGAQVQIALAPCSPFSVSEELMRESAALADKHDVLLHTHLAETLDEENFCLQRFGCRTVDYLERVGWLQPRTWLAHGIHFDDAEIARLGAASVGVAHCPGSNMMLASGICRSLELEGAGVRLGLAVDGSASNDSSNMIVEARLAMYLQRLRYGAAAVTHIDALRWATAGSAAVLGRSDIGTLAPGMQADLALFKLDELPFAGSHDPLAALLLCGAHKADRVMVGGEWRVTDGEIVGLDLDALKAQQRRQATTLLQTYRA